MHSVTSCRAFFQCFAFACVTQLLVLTRADAQIVDRSRLQEGALSSTGQSGLLVAESAALSQRSLEEENEFAPASPGDDDLGEQLILKQTPKNRPFRFFADTYWFWTDNAANVSAGKLDDMFYGASAGVAWQPRLSRKTFLDVSLTQRLTRYDEFDILDFESLEAAATLLYVEPRLANIIFFTGVMFNRITTDNFSDDLYNSTSIRVGAQKIFLINRRNSIHIGLLADWDIDTDVDPLFRHEYIGDAAWRFKVTRTLLFTLNYRFSWMDYQRFDRDDALQIAGATLSWQPKPWLEVYTNANFAFNDSSVPFFDYETTALGGGLGLRIKF